MYLQTPGKVLCTDPAWLFARPRGTCLPAAAFFTTNPGTCPAVALDKLGALLALHQCSARLLLPKVPKVAFDFWQRFLSLSPYPSRPTAIQPPSFFAIRVAIIRPLLLKMGTGLGRLKLQLPPV